MRFYSGIPDKDEKPIAHAFWSAKLAVMSRQGIHLCTRPLRYRNTVFTAPDGSTYTKSVGREKGIDVRLALDVIGLAHRRWYDVALIFSQDQDLAEVVQEVTIISSEQNRWIKIATAFPYSPTISNRRGIDRTDWIKIKRAQYDACLDTRDYSVQTKQGDLDLSSD